MWFEPPVDAFHREIRHNIRKLEKSGEKSRSFKVSRKALKHFCYSGMEVSSHRSRTINAMHEDIKDMLRKELLKYGECITIDAHHIGHDSIYIISKIQFTNLILRVHAKGIPN